MGGNVRGMNDECGMEEGKVRKIKTGGRVRRNGRIMVKN
jgi:hypothetical protein